MPDLTPSDKVRIKLEQNMSQDAIARARKIKLESTAILPTFMGENGKVKRLGQCESRALIVPNIYYGIGEEMRPIPVRGGLSMVDNKSALLAVLPAPIFVPPLPPLPPLPPIRWISGRFTLTYNDSGSDYSQEVDFYHEVSTNEPFTFAPPIDSATAYFNSTFSESSNRIDFVASSSGTLKDITFQLNSTIGEVAREGDSYRPVTYKFWEGFEYGSLQASGEELINDIKIMTETNYAYSQFEGFLINVQSSDPTGGNGDLLLNINGYIYLEFL
jgi:hypothetical protein